LWKDELARLMQTRLTRLPVLLAGKQQHLPAFFAP
jgi:hypothetical protein